MFNHVKDENDVEAQRFRPISDTKEPRRRGEIRRDSCPPFARRLKRRSVMTVVEQDPNKISIASTKIETPDSALKVGSEPVDEAGARAARETLFRKPRLRDLRPEAVDVAPVPDERTRWVNQD
jgi:hypothetical protein